MKWYHWIEFPIALLIYAIAYPFWRKNVTGRREIELDKFAPNK